MKIRPVWLVALNVYTFAGNDPVNGAGPARGLYSRMPRANWADFAAWGVCFD